MATWQSATLQSNGIKLHYTRTGGDKPPIVLVHGFSDDGMCWIEVARALEGDYDLIMPDARGHGRSEGPEFGYAPQDMAADLAGLIEQLGLGRPAVFGHSMGAQTTLTLAALYPEKVGSVLLEDPPPWWMPELAQAALNDPSRPAKRRAEIVEMKRYTSAEMIARQRQATPHWSDSELETWADAKLRLSFNLTNRAAAPDLEWGELLRKISCPSLLLSADPSLGGMVTPEAAQGLQERIPQLEIAAISGAGHCIHRDKFEQTMQAVRAFLAQHYPA